MLQFLAIILLPRCFSLASSLCCLLFLAADLLQFRCLLRCYFVLTFPPLLSCFIDAARVVFRFSNSPFCCSRINLSMLPVFSQLLARLQRWSIVLPSQDFRGTCAIFPEPKAVVMKNTTRLQFDADAGTTMLYPLTTPIMFLLSFVVLHCMLSFMIVLLIYVDQFQMMSSAPCMASMRSLKL